MGRYFAAIRSSRVLLLGFMLLIVGIALSLIADYPVYGTKSFSDRVAINRTLVDVPLAQPDLSGFSPYNSTLLISFDRDVNASLIVDNRYSKPLFMKRNVRQSVKFRHAPELYLRVVKGDLPANLTYSYSVWGYARPYIWLSIPSFLIVMVGVVMSIRGYIDVIRGLFSEEA